MSGDKKSNDDDNNRSKLSNGNNNDGHAANDVKYRLGGGTDGKTNNKKGQHDVVDNNNKNDNSENGDDKKFVVRVAVGSKNPCKIDAVKNALQRAIGLSSSLQCEIRIEGFNVSSGVQDQPFGDVSLLPRSKREPVTTMPYGL